MFFLFDVHKRRRRRRNNILSNKKMTSPMWETDSFSRGGDGGISFSPRRAIPFIIVSIHQLLMNDDPPIADPAIYYPFWLLFFTGKNYYFILFFKKMSFPSRLFCCCRRRLREEEEEEMESIVRVKLSCHGGDYVPVWCLPVMEYSKRRRRRRDWGGEEEEEESDRRYNKRGGMKKKKWVCPGWLDGRLARSSLPFAFCVFFYINGSVTGAAFLVTKRCAAVTFQFTTVVTNAVVSSFFFIFSPLTEKRTFSEKQPTVSGIVPSPSPPQQKKKKDSLSHLSSIIISISLYSANRWIGCKTARLLFIFIIIIYFFVFWYRSSS